MELPFLPFVSYDGGGGAGGTAAASGACAALDGGSTALGFDGVGWGLWDSR